MRLRAAALVTPIFNKETLSRPQSFSSAPPRRTRRTREGSFASKAEVEKMIQELEIAIALDPDFADAYSVCAFARARAGDTAGALADMQKAISLNPRDENY